MKFSEYPFHAALLWERPEPLPILGIPNIATPTGHSGNVFPLSFSGDVALDEQRLMNGAPTGRPTRDACRRIVRRDLGGIAKADPIVRAWLETRCGHCAQCPKLMAAHGIMRRAAS